MMRGWGRGDTVTFLAAEIWSRSAAQAQYVTVHFQNNANETCLTCLITMCF